MVVCERMIHPDIQDVSTAALGIAALLLSSARPAPVRRQARSTRSARHGGSSGGFSKADLQDALGGVPADLDEYFGCSAQIQPALVDKATQNIPVAERRVKGSRRSVKGASANDLTTAAERKKLAYAGRRGDASSTRSKPLSSKLRSGDLEAAGKTLASSAAPGTPTALIIGVIGLLMLLGADLAGRLGKMPRVKKYLPWSGPRDDS